MLVAMGEDGENLIFHCAAKYVDLRNQNISTKGSSLVPTVASSRAMTRCINIILTRVQIFICFIHIIHMFNISVKITFRTG